MSRSSDRGQTFQPSVIVNDDPGVIQHAFDALHRDSDGRLHLSWIDGRDGKKDPGTYVARSLDRGQTVTKNMKVVEGTLFLLPHGDHQRPGRDGLCGLAKNIRGKCSRNRAV